MKPVLRRSVIKSLGIVAADSLMSGRIFADESGSRASVESLVSRVSSDSICVFLDGTWLLRPTDGNVMALTVDDGSQLYSQGIWKGAPITNPLDEGSYEVTRFGSRASCSCPSKTVSGQSRYVPYIHGVQCVFEPTPTGAGKPVDPSLRIINLPIPDKFHTAARIGFGKSDFQGAESFNPSAFRAPRGVPTVTIFEYKNARALTVANKLSGSPPLTLQKGQHYHFRVSLQYPDMSPDKERQHIKMISTSLAKLLQHQSDASPVDFYIDPADMKEGNTLRVERGVLGISDDELGMNVTRSSNDRDSSRGLLFGLGEPGPGGHFPFYAKLANCAGGQLGGDD